MTATPRTWTASEMAQDAHAAVSAFRWARLGEPLALWKATFRASRREVRAVFRELDLRAPQRIHSRQIAQLYRMQLGDALRYLAAPPISADDLKVLADSTLSGAALRKPSQARSVLRTIQQTLDPFRFQWVITARRPSPAEWKAAIVATASLLTYQRVATIRRNADKDDQERAVKAYLRDVLGLREEAPRKIDTMRDTPPPGSFCGESEVDGRKADIVVSLHDGRLLLIECKVSNSALNSVKRLNNDAAAKAAHWIKAFGVSQVVPAAMLSGVFKTRHLAHAQDQQSLALFWAHRLEDLGAFVNATK
jgi:hypothetical protein